MKRLMKRVISAIMMITILTGIISYAAPAGTVKAAGETLKLTVKHPDMNTIKLSWEKLENAYGYKVYYKASGSATYKLVSETLDNKIVFEGLKNDYFYYFRVDAYSIVSGKEVTVATTGDNKIRSNKIGIDVSTHNGTIDWNKVKAAGIEYAIVRVSYGVLAKYEQTYDEKIRGAQKAGIPVGVYVYSRARNVKEAREEADYALKLIKGYKLQYPVAFDIEDERQSDNGSGSAGRKLNTDLTKAFCEKIKAAGYRPMVYTGCSFSRTYLNINDLSAYDLWIAHYGSDEKYTSYTGNYHFGCKTKPKTRFWQYSSWGKVNGINGRVDMNYELDLRETEYGMSHYNVSTGKETYVAASGETLESIADKYNVSVNELIKNDTRYQAASVIKKGTNINIDSNYIADNGKKVAQVSNVQAVGTQYDTITVKWSPLNYSDGYYVYRSEQRNGTYTKVATVTGTSYQNKNLTNRKTYYYKVYGFKKNESAIIVSPSAATVGAYPTQAAPTRLRATNVTYDSITLSWNKPSNATSYKIYMATSKNGTYKRIGTSKTNSFTHKKLTTGQTYYYKVEAMRAVGKRNYWSDMTGVFQARAQLNQVNVTSIQAGSRRATLKWNSVKGARGYMIYRSTSRNSGYRKVATVSATNYTSTGLVKNKGYYYRVRAYRIVNGKTVYGAYSAVKGVRAK